ncbi:hypothetical protein L208DRAFT_1390180 [Tricholoma matsutake]|nr:hypothetical protein L208DRAFT_1390180 [Tricholoma matsutake 945]
MNGVGDKRMDDEGNETGHHSWLLDIDINGLPYSRIWIRAGYTTTSILTTTTLHPFGLGPAPVVTGQPSIGESMRCFIRLSLKHGLRHGGKNVWVYYALRLCLAKRKPVILYDNGPLLFIEDGVYTFRFSRGRLPTICLDPGRLGRV